MFNIRILILTLVISLSMGFSGLQGRRSKNMFNVKIGHMPVSLEPSKVMFMEHFLILQCFAQTLVRLNEDGNIIGDLASSWSFSNKGKTVTFTIDKNHSFSNGDGVTAQDVLNSFKSHFEGSNNSAVKGYIEKIVDSKSTSSYEPNIVVLGDNKIQFHLKGQFQVRFQIILVRLF